MMLQNENDIKMGRDSKGGEELRVVQASKQPNQISSISFSVYMNINHTAWIALWFIEIARPH